MQTRYLIAERNGRYEARVETSMGSEQMVAEVLAGRVGAQILYKGTLEDTKKISVVFNVVDEANKLGKFDSKLLEQKLLE